LTQQSSFSPDKFRDIQADRFSLHAQSLLPILLRHVHVDDTIERQAVGLLTNWNFDASGGRAEPALFGAWFLRLGRLLVEDDLGGDTAISWQRRYSFAHRFIVNTISGNDGSWCDDVETAEHETCDEIVSKTLREAVADLRERLGDDVRQWRWQDVHRAVFPHSGLDAIGIVRPLVSRSRPSGGDWSTVNVGAIAVDRPYDQTELPGYRQIVDLSPANDSRFLDAVGESGHLLSPHYDDFLDDWQAVRHRPMLMERTAIEKHAIGRLTLRPR
jgi:penicillin G amidase